MSKLTPEALAELQKSDPAAFDMDDEPAALAAPVEGGAGTATTDDKTRDDKGRFKAKDDTSAEEAAPAEVDDVAAAAPAKGEEAQPPKVESIPKARFDEVIAERNADREARLAAERRLAEIEAAQAKASARDYAGEIAALEQKYEDGDVDFVQYQKDRDALVTAQAQEAALAAHNERMQKQAEQDRQAAWESAQTRFFGDHKEYIDDEDGTLMGALSAAVTKIAQSGVTDYNEMLRLAHDKVAAKFSPKADDPAPAMPDAGATRRADAARAAGAASNTPPPVSGGVGGRGTPSNVIDLNHLKPGKFSDLPKDQQEALLGEGAL
jgi:hypothetical protein